MKQMLQRVLTAMVCIAAVALASAQTPATGPGPGASAPGIGMRGGGPMQGWRMNKGNTPGWSMMSPQERVEHRNKMMGMKTFDECHAYMGQHHAAMVERAKSKGRSAPNQPRRDPCLRLKG